MSVCFHRIVYMVSSSLIVIAVGIDSLAGVTADHQSQINFLNVEDNQ